MMLAKISKPPTLSPAPSIIVLVSAFDSEPFELAKPIPVVIQELNEGFLATFFDANINAFGETQQGAFENLKDMILTVYQRLKREPTKSLGKEPKRQLGVLSQFLRRKRRTTVAG